MKLDDLVIAAHPDDAEISLGGTILLLLEAGRRVGVVDLTRGELGTRGTGADRTRETDEATRRLGLTLRENLELPDGRLTVSVEAREALAGVIRRHRPSSVYGHHLEDLHPDHVAAGRLTREAWYLAGLRRLAERDGEALAHRPPRLYHFMGHVPFEPTLVVDIGPVWERKVEVIRAYASQLEPRDEADSGSHFLFGSDILARAETRARYYGERIGARYGEPLLHQGPLATADPHTL